MTCSMLPHVTGPLADNTVDLLSGLTATTYLNHGEPQDRTEIALATQFIQFEYLFLLNGRATTCPLS